MSKRPIKKLVENIVKEFTETSKRVSPRLIYLAKLAKHYDTFEKFEDDYQMKNFHGIYWHLTTNPNFQINPGQIPTDMSSLAGGSGSQSGLMVTVDLPGWHDTFDRRRQYAAQIDLSDLVPNVDYRHVGRGFGHEIFVFKPEGAKVVKVLPIRQALKQNYDDYRRNLPQNESQLRRIYDLAHGIVQESYVDPSATGDEYKFRITPLEEKYAVNYIRKKLLPTLILKFNFERIGRNKEYAQYGKRYKGPFNEPITDEAATVKSLKRVDKKYQNIPVWMKHYGEFTYEAKSANGATFEFIIEKSEPHVVRVNSLDPWQVGYMGYELRPGGYPGGSLGFDALIKEGKAVTLPKEAYVISKFEEDTAFDYIKQILVPHVVKIFHEQFGDPNITAEEIKRGLKKIIQEPFQFYKGNVRDIIGWRYKKGKVVFTFFIIKYYAGVLFVGYKDPFEGYTYFISGKVPIMRSSIDLPFNYRNLFKEGVEIVHPIPFNELSGRLFEKISKEEEQRALQLARDWIRKRYPSIADKVTKELRRVYEPTNDPKGIITYSNNPLSKYGYFSFRIIKLDGIVGLYDATGKQYSGLPYTGLIANLTEAVQPTNILTKEDEMRALQWIRNFIKERYPQMDKLEDITMKLRKVPDKKPNAPNAASYATPKVGGSYFFFRIVKMDEGVTIFANADMSWHSLNPSTPRIDENIGMEITKEDEYRAIQFIKKQFAKEFGPDIGRHLIKFRHTKAESPDESDDIMYDLKIGNRRSAFRITRTTKGLWVCRYGEGEKDFYDQCYNLDAADLGVSIKENMERPSKHTMTKQDVDYTFHLIKSQLIPIFVVEINNKIPIYLSQYKQSPRDLVRNLRRVDQEILPDGTYLSVSYESHGKSGKDRYRFRALRNSVGQLVVGFHNPHSQRSPEEGGWTFYDKGELDHESTGLQNLTESSPTGDWQSWETITKPEKDRLKLILEDWIAYIRKIYHPNLASTRTYLVQKTINNLDVTDPRFAAKPLAQLSMEDRLSLSDYVDYKDTTGQTSKVMDFLLRISRDYIEPPRPPKPDITLKGITRVESPTMKYAGDVEIYGLADMRPIIGFGYGGYSLTDDFIKEFSRPGAKLWLDMGQEVIVVNMPEVMKRVQDALEKYKQSLTEVRIFDPGEYERAIQHVIQALRFTKNDEAVIFRHLQDKIVNGERVGKTLRKTHHQVTTSPESGDILTYSAKPGGKEIFYKVIKTSTYAATISYHFNDGHGYNSWKLTLSEGMDTTVSPVILTKEDEDRAVQYLKSLVIYDERVGKTLKKLGWVPPDGPNSSKRVIYAAKIRGVDYNFDIFRSPRRGGLIIISKPDYKKYTVDVGPAKVVHPLTIPKPEV